MKALLMSLLLLALAMPAASNPIPEPPDPGVYTSIVLFNPYYTESWSGSGGHLELGNTFNASVESGVFDFGYCSDPVNGIWAVSCPRILSSPSLISDGRDPGGNGDVVWSTDYQSGTFSLSSVGPWKDDASGIVYSGEVTRFRMVTTISYDAGVISGIEADITAVGEFEYFSDLCLQIQMQLNMVSTTDSGSVPLGYPELLDTGCNGGTRMEGSYGIISDNATLKIVDCSIPTEGVTWGQVKKIWGKNR